VLFARRSLAKVGLCVLALTLAGPAQLAAVDWPWSKKPHQLTAECSVEPSQVEQGSQDRLRARIEATDSQGHALAYAWSSNGGLLLGDGKEVEVNASELPVGVYSVVAAVQDAYRQQARCTAHFQVMRRPNRISMSCTSESPVVEAGEAASFRAMASDSLGYELRYIWFANGGTIRGEGPEVSLDTTGLGAGQYTVTGRAEDGGGGAADCVATVTVRVVVIAPVVLPEPVAIASILFVANQSLLDESQKAQLERVLERLRQETTARISIESYAGPEERQPDQLAAARAEAVRQYLAEQGAEQSRIQVLVGLGGRLGGLRNRTLDIIWLPEGAEY